MPRWMRKRDRCREVLEALAGRNDAAWSVGTASAFRTHHRAVSRCSRTRELQASCTFARPAVVIADPRIATFSRVTRVAATLRNVPSRFILLDRDHEIVVVPVVVATTPASPSTTRLPCVKVMSDLRHPRATQTCRLR